MARKVRIELDLDDNGMVTAVQADRKAVAKLGDTLDTTNRKASRFGEIAKVAFGTLAANAIGSAVAGLGRLARAGFGQLDDAIKKAGIQQIAEGKLRQALKNMGDTSEETFQQMTALASSIQQVSNFGDEEIITAQAMLASFKELGAEGVQVLSSDMVDLAAGIANVEGGTVDLNKAAAAIGKAFTDGSGALKRYGISMTDAQAKQFDTLQGMEKVNALSEILKGNFEGLASATVDPFQQLSNSVGDLQEQLGAQLRPEITRLVDDMRAFVEDPRTVDFTRQIGAAFVEVINVAMKAFGFFERMSAGIRASIRLAIGSARTAAAQAFEILAGIANRMAPILDAVGFDGAASKLREINAELTIRALANKAMAQGELELAAAILAGNQALEERAAALTSGAAGGAGGAGGSGAGAGAAEAPGEDPLAMMRKRREALIMQGEVTEELIRLQTQIANIERERAFVAEASTLRKVELAELEKTTEEDVAQKIIDRTTLELEAIGKRIEATEAEANAKRRAAQAEKRALQQSIQSSAQSVLTSQNSASAIKSTIKGLITAELAKAIAKSLGDLGPAALIVGPLVAAGLKAMFSSLIPGFATGGTVQGPPGTDNVLTRLTPGEEVINARASAENRPLLKAINAGAPLSAAMGPMEVDINIGGQLVANNDQIVAQIENTQTTIANSRGQVRTRQAA